MIMILFLGASDDGAGCAVMLEMLRVIAQSDRILKHNIIFLFNGGEENFLPASHGFITQHAWAKEVILVYDNNFVVLPTIILIVGSCFHKLRSMRRRWKRNTISSWS